MNPLVSCEDGIGIPVVAPVRFVKSSVVAKTIMDSLGFLSPKKRSPLNEAESGLIQADNV